MDVVKFSVKKRSNVTNRTQYEKYISFIYFLEINEIRYKINAKPFEINNCMNFILHY
jgi:hypothetical protein